MSRGNRRKGGKSRGQRQADDPGRKNPDGKPQDDPSKTHKGNDFKNELPTPIASSPALAGGEPPTEQNYKKEWPQFEWMTFWTAALVAIGFITCGILIWQNSLTNRSVVATEEANRIARQNFENSQRAWIAPQDVTVRGELEQTGEARFSVVYRNVGREPATKVRYIVGIGWPKKGEQANWPDHCLMAQRSTDFRLVAYPTESIAYAANANIYKGDNIDLVLKGERVFHVKGCFVYTTFSTEHFSRFCFYWIHKPDTPIAQWEWRYCPSGNEAN